MKRNNLIRTGRNLLITTLVGSIGVGSALFGCRRGGDGAPPDTELPVVSLASDKAQYDKEEAVSFTGSATDNVGVAEEGIDLDAAVNSDGVGEAYDDLDLESLTSVFEGGYTRAGIYGVTGWAKDSAENLGSEGLTLIIKPYAQFSEVQDSITGLASYPSILREITVGDFDLMYPMLSAGAQTELNGLENAIASSARDAVAKYHLTDSGLIYEMDITDASQFTGFTNDNYSGNLPLTQATFNELHKNLMENATEVEALALIAGLAPEGAEIFDGQGVALPGQAPINFDVAMRYFLPNGQEVNLNLEYKTAGDTFSAEEQARVDAFNSMFHPPYYPISALGIEVTTALGLKKTVLQEIQYHQDNN